MKISVVSYIALQACAPGFLESECYEQDNRSGSFPLRVQIYNQGFYNWRRGYPKRAYSYLETVTSDKLENNQHSSHHHVRWPPS